MSTIVRYECRNLDHLRGGSRHGSGGLVIHHGSVGYCDGLHADGAHRWVATGGVPIEYLFENAPEIDPGTYRTNDGARSEEHTSELQSRGHLVCRLLLEKKNTRARRAPPDEQGGRGRLGAVQARRRVRRAATAHPGGPSARGEPVCRTCRNRRRTEAWPG